MASMPLYTCHSSRICRTDAPTYNPAISHVESMPLPSLYFPRHFNAAVTNLQMLGVISCKRGCRDSLRTRFLLFGEESWFDWLTAVVVETEYLFEDDLMKDSTKRFFWLLLDSNNLHSSPNLIYLLLAMTPEFWQQPSPIESLGSLGHARTQFSM